MYFILSIFIFICYVFMCRGLHFSISLFYRATHLAKRPLTNAHRNILDGKLIRKYLGLNFTERLELARKIGTTSSQVFEYSDICNKCFSTFIASCFLTNSYILSIVVKGFLKVLSL